MDLHMQHQPPGVERAALLAELITQPANTATGIPAMCETGSTTDEEWQHRRHAGLRLAGLKSGDRFLDVAAGPGGLSLPAARLGAKVLATDWSPAGIERFEARVRAEGLSDAEGRVMDAHALEIDDDTFDVTGSQGGSC
jgi:cyclopropane fatty-acyl-phospholipid synthase-like methyltransferase